MRGSSVNGVSVISVPDATFSVARQLDRLELGTVDEGVADAFAEVAGGAARMTLHLFDVVLEENISTGLP